MDWFRRINVGSESPHHHSENMPAAAPHEDEDAFDLMSSQEDEDAFDIISSVEFPCNLDTKKAHRPTGSHVSRPPFQCSQENEDTFDLISSVEFPRNPDTEKAHRPTRSRPRPPSFQRSTSSTQECLQVNCCFRNKPGLWHCSSIDNGTYCPCCLYGYWLERFCEKSKKGDYFLEDGLRHLLTPCDFLPNIWPRPGYEPSSEAIENAMGIISKMDTRIKHAARLRQDATTSLGFQQAYDMALVSLGCREGFTKKHGKQLTLGDLISARQALETAVAAYREVERIEACLKVYAERSCPEAKQSLTSTEPRQLLKRLREGNSPVIPNIQRPEMGTGAAFGFLGKGNEPNMLTHSRDDAEFAKEVDLAAEKRKLDVLSADQACSPEELRRFRAKLRQSTIASRTAQSAARSLPRTPPSTPSSILPPKRPVSPEPGFVDLGSSLCSLSPSQAETQHEAAGRVEIEANRPKLERAATFAFAASGFMGRFFRSLGSKP
ncbi:hypothetical protein BJ508DRAFT_341893 [Ascobolus immersus RN42]|uniref:Uncharacterized protein n=1 Tax=Ascobolus immersus RN42 TaxID=1160509 RepID=A0A3N4IQ09_ASCIM|nr:hypothetical protein BJ508DRAFT_341893 [Ascobolus immersus RN42]